MRIHLGSAYIWLNSQKFKVLDMNEIAKTITIDPDNKSDLFCNEEDKYGFLKYTGPGHRITLEDFMSENNVLGVKLLSKNEKEVCLSYQVVYYFGKTSDEDTYDLHYSSHPLRH